MISRINIACLAAAFMALALGSTAVAASETKEAVLTIQGVRYTLPTNSMFRIPPLAHPFRYQFEYMQVVIKDRELFINCVSRYKARSGDTVKVTYIPNDVWVNGKIIPEQPTMLSSCPQ